MEDLQRVESLRVNDKFICSNGFQMVGAILCLWHFCCDFPPFLQEIGEKFFVFVVFFFVLVVLLLTIMWFWCNI